MGTNVAEKSEYKGVRLPPELVERIQQLADFMHAEGLSVRSSWSEALQIILRQAEKTGLMDIPPAWYSPTPKSKRK